MRAVYRAALRLCSEGQLPVGYNPLQLRGGCLHFLFLCDQSMSMISRTSSGTAFRPRPGSIESRNRLKRSLNVSWLTNGTSCSASTIVAVGSPGKKVVRPLTSARQGALYGCGGLF